MIAISQCFYPMISTCAFPMISGTPQVGWRVRTIPGKFPNAPTKKRTTLGSYFADQSSWPDDDDGHISASTQHIPPSDGFQLCPKSSGEAEGFLETVPNAERIKGTIWGAAWYISPIYPVGRKVKLVISQLLPNVIYLRTRKDFMYKLSRLARQKDSCTAETTKGTTWSAACYISLIGPIFRMMMTLMFHNEPNASHLRTPKDFRYKPSSLLRQKDFWKLSRMHPPQKG